MKYTNIVFCSHPNCSKTYLFLVQAGRKITKGANLLVDTMRGECPAFAACDSFYVTEKQLAEIISGTGAYLPLRMVVGEIHRFDIPEIPF